MGMSQLCVGEVVVNVRRVEGLEHAVGTPRNMSVEDFREELGAKTYRRGARRRLGICSFLVSGKSLARETFEAS